ncbi:hypothetical protein CABS03_02647 [Colletotrichum abscissum]|uniref:Uncharacterized protein n=2 Tax=Colletotrichum abscissum TaxID=1671311 RepID=A0A9P9XPN7_9PEZI|nr:hypothetical protein CABS02_01338 [Colletotrichum abscissum]
MAMLRTLRNIPPVLLSPPTKEDETFSPHFGAGHSCQNTLCLSSPSSTAALCVQPSTLVACRAAVRHAQPAYREAQVAVKIQILAACMRTTHMSRLFLAFDVKIPKCHSIHVHA